ncbi:hypothetical protein F5X98DRAFT_388366 [Xylaria grammica]|nr:hypothetical protein F5X98DRAFT_388366 [Xylaria grammica]
MRMDTILKEPLFVAPSKAPKYLLVANVLLLTVSACLFSASFYILKFNPGRDCEAELSRHTSFFSPALDSMMPQWTPQLSSEKPLESNESVWRQSPSDAVDLAWERVTDVGMLEITREQLLKLGKDPSSSVHAAPEWSGRDEGSEDGDERYLAIIDGVHLMHCLNSMRKSLYHNYHYYFPNGYPPSYGAHLSHCQEMIADWLMCQPSIEFVSFGWYERRDPPFPDFDITHKCVDYEQILEWQNQHRIKGLTKLMFDALRPEDGVTRRTSTVMYDEILDHRWDEILEAAEHHMRFSDA